MKNVKERGITLIALVVTIVVLLILAGISIAMLAGDDGIIAKARESRLMSEIGEEKDAISLAYNSAKIGKLGQSVVAKDVNEQFEINETKATAEDGADVIIVKFTKSKRQYTINTNGEITGPTNTADGENNVPETYSYYFNAGDNITAYLVETGEYTIGENPYNGHEMMKPICDITFVGTGEMYSMEDWNTYQMEVSIDGEGGLGEVAYYVEFNNVKISEGITSIGDYAFACCNDLKNIEIPDSVTSIGQYAFYECSNLADVKISNNITTVGKNALMETPWHNNLEEGLIYIGKVCTGYKGELEEDIEIKSGTTKIADSAFLDGYELKSIKMPDTVTSIGSSAFSYCENLTDIQFSKNIESIGNGNTFGETPWYENQPAGSIYIGKVFYGYKGEMEQGAELEIAEGTVQIAENAVSEDSNITSLKIPDTVTSIGSYAFNYCENLTDIEISKNIESIGYEVFYGTPWYENQPTGSIYIGKVFYEYKGEMPEGTELEIKEGTTQIYNGALMDQENLTSIKIPSTMKKISFPYGLNLTKVTIEEGVEIIGESAFEGCTSLTDITIPSSVKVIGEYAFYGCTNLTNLTIEEGVKHIKDWAFYGTGITELTIPSSITRIGEEAFGGCENLANVVIEDGVLVSIGDSAFAWCENLESITIGEGVKHIDNWVFSGCMNLTNIQIPSTVESLGEEVFTDTPWEENLPTGDIYVGKIYYKYIPSEEEDEETINIEIKEGTKVINSYIFEYNGGDIASIKIPDSVKIIKMYAFQNCSNITSIIIPKSVKVIEDDVFEYCDNLENIYCEATEKPSGWSNSWCENEEIVTWGSTGSTQE